MMVDVGGNLAIGGWTLFVEMFAGGVSAIFKLEIPARPPVFLNCTVMT